MDPNAPKQDGKETAGATSDGGGEFKAPASQEELDRIIGARVERERGKFADYSDLKAKAAKLDQIEEANKTEQQKLADKLAAAEQAKVKAEADALRFKVASKFGVPDEDVELFLTGSDEDTLTKQAQRLAERTDQRKKSGNHVPREGTTTTAVESDDRAFVRGLFGSGD